MFIQKPLPLLTHLNILSAGEHVPLLPPGFLGGSAPSLQEVTLSAISFPQLSTLLSSARDLVTLNLQLMPPTAGDYISPEALVACLAAFPRLQTFDIQFHPSTPRADQIQPIPHHITRTVLPALTGFRLDGPDSGDYLEDFTARIDCPRLKAFYFVHFAALLVNLRVTQLMKFFERLIAPRTSPFKAAKVRLDTPGVFLHTYRPDNRPGWDWHLAKTEISGHGIDWRASPLTNMLRRFSPMLSPVLYLNLVANFSGFLPGESDVSD